MIRSSSPERPSGSEKEGTNRLGLKDKLWIALAIAIFVVAFAIILLYGVF